MTTLAVQTLKHLTLEQVLTLGFDSLPNTPEFYKLLAQRLHHVLASHYELSGLSKFERDLRFIMEHKGKPLQYDDEFAIYWTKKGDKFMTITASYMSEDVDIYNFDTLEEMLNCILFMIEFRIRIMSGKEIIKTLLNKVFRETLDVLVSQYRQPIKHLNERLENGDAIAIKKPPTDLSFFPLTQSASIVLFMNDGLLTIIGTKKDGWNEEGYINIQTYMLQFLPEDKDRVLAIFAYNQEKVIQ